MYKQALGAAGIRPQPEDEIRVDPFLEGKRVPTERLIARMGLAKYDRDAPYRAEPVKPGKVVIPLRQHIGKPSEPAVRVGDVVREGDVIGKMPAKALSARVHASIAGRVTRVTEKEIEITGGEAV